MAALFRRRPRLPGDRRPPLAPDERVLAWAVAHPSGPAAAPTPGTPTTGGSATGGSVTGGPTPDAGTVVVTNLGVWLPGKTRIGWHEIHKAVWSGRVLTITPAETVAEHEGYAVVADLTAASYLLLEPGDVPHQVRARVTKSVAYSRHHPAAGGGIRVVARRVPGVDGLSWTVRFDPGTDSSSTEARNTATDLVSLARTTL